MQLLIQRGLFLSCLRQFDSFALASRHSARSKTLFVNTLTGKTLQLNFENWYTIDRIKSMIQDKEHISLDKQCFIYEGKQLEDGRAVGDELILLPLLC